MQKNPDDISDAQFEGGHDESGESEETYETPTEFDQIQSLIEKIENSIILIRNSKELAGWFKNG